MNQRRLVWQALRDAGILESDDAQVQELVRFVRERSELCWSDYVSEFRQRYYALYDKIVPALEASNDPLIRNMLIKFADPKQAKERDLLVKLASNTDFERDSLAADQLENLHVPEVDEQLRRRGRAPGGASRSSRAGRGSRRSES